MKLLQSIYVLASFLAAADAAAGGQSGNKAGGNPNSGGGTTAAGGSTSSSPGNSGSGGGGNPGNGGGNPNKPFPGGIDYDGASGAPDDWPPGKGQGRPMGLAKNQPKSESIDIGEPTLIIDTTDLTDEEIKALDIEDDDVAEVDVSDEDDAAIKGNNGKGHGSQGKPDGGTGTDPAEPIEELTSDPNIDGGISDFECDLEEDDCLEVDGEGGDSQGMEDTGRKLQLRGGSLRGGKDASDGHSSRHLTINTKPIGIFGALGCNLEVGNELSTQPCLKSEGGSSFADAVMAAAGSPVVLACNTCYEYDLPEGINIINGLDIQGKLYVPPNYKSTLHTPYVFVQGELEMSDTQQISRDNASMTIVLTGTTPVTFAPADTNSHIAPFDAGFKPFLVAGGKLTIKGWDLVEGNEGVSPEGLAAEGSSTETWTPLLSMAEGDLPTPVPDNVPGHREGNDPTKYAYQPGKEFAPVDLTDHFRRVPSTGEATQQLCSLTVVDHDFEDGIDHRVWSGGEGGMVDHVDGALVIRDMHKTWHGPRLDFTEIAQECPIIDQATYLITIRMKMTHDDHADGTMTSCEESNERCPHLERRIYRDSGDRVYDMDIEKGDIGKWGEWFHVSFTWRWSAEFGDLDADVYAQSFRLENFQQGTTVYVDRFTLELPGPNSFADTNDPCRELITNGDAENNDGFGFSAYPFYSPDTSYFHPQVIEEYGNKFYRAHNRGRTYHHPRMWPNADCFVNGFLYQASVRVRITNYVGSLSYYVRFYGYNENGDGKSKVMINCDSQSEADGWVTCSGPWLVDEEMEGLTRVRLEFHTNSDENTAAYATFDYDDIHVTLKSGPAEGITVSASAITRWAANSDLHITSSTLEREDSQEASLESITVHENGSATLKLDKAIAAVLTDKETPGLGVEVALLTRNIKITSDATDEYTGGYLQVFHTPNVVQTIEGVEFSNMGVENAKNRVPIQFLYNRRVAGSSASRNTVRNSAWCINIDGTLGVTVASNIGHDVSENCYHIGDEAIDNLILYNLASRGHGSTFDIRTPENDYIGNVAAGSRYHGIKVSLDYRTKAEDDSTSSANRIGPGGNIRRDRARAFRDNRAHSNYYKGFILENYEQFFTFRNEVDVPIFENMMAYRNREHGIYSYNCIGAEFRGGVLHDNQWAFTLRRQDRILVQDFDIRGATDVFREHTATRSRKICSSSSSWRHEGLQITPQLWRTGHSDPKRGLRLNNVNITGFDRDWYPNCKSSEPIGYYSTSDKYDGHVDYVSSAKDVIIEDSRGMIMDGCRFASQMGVEDFVMTDVDGSLDPSGASSGGVLVQDAPFVTDILGNNTCTSIGNCMAYCAGVCLRTFSLNVEQYGTEAWKLRITNEATGAIMVVPGTLRWVNDKWWLSNDSKRRFSASLPSGTYTAEFLDDQGNPAWPTFVEEQWEKEPDCSGSATTDSLTIIEPAISESECHELVRNAPQDGPLTTTEPWIHFSNSRGTLDIASGGGMDGGDAIVTSGRDQYYRGFGQHIDSRCVKHFEGDYFEFSAWMRFTNTNEIDPNHKDRNPGMTWEKFEYRNAATKNAFKHTEVRHRAVLSRNYDSSGWNLIHGIARLPVGVPHLAFDMDRAEPKQAIMHAGHVSYSKMTCDPDELWRNGDLETGNSKYWDTWGSEVKLELVDGYGDTGSALRSFNRGTSKSHSQSQLLNTDCLSEGDLLMITAKVKVEGGACDPFEWDEVRNGGRCPDMFIYTNHYTSSGSRTYEYSRVAEVSINNDELDDGGWYTISGMWNVRESQLLPGVETTAYFDGLHPSQNMILDNVQVKHVPQNCNAIVKNPSFEDGANFWTVTERRSGGDDSHRGKISLYSPGAGGASDFALRSHTRMSYWRGGIRQRLDRTCFLKDDEYVITAKFRLLNSTGHGVSCNTNDQTITDENCPNVAIWGDKCEDDGVDVWWRFWNTLSDFTWDPNSFNDFESAKFTSSDYLKTCDYIYVYINYVDEEFDIVVDDLQISPYATPPPTPEPTDGATEVDTAAGTSSPTVSPTSRPTVSTTTACPQTENDPSVIPAGPVMLARSDTLCVLTKAIEDTNGVLSSIAPVALSYDSNDWESAAGEFAAALLSGQGFGTYTDGSHIILPELGEGEKYFLTTYSHSLARSEDGVARFLETATFGTTPSDIAGGRRLMTVTSAKQWVEEQMAIDLTSHREFFRKRVNPRLTYPARMARSNHPCDELSRWRKFSFTKRDGLEPQTFEAVTGVDGYITIKLNSHVRTVVMSLDFDRDDYTLQFNTEYLVCSTNVDDYHNGRFWLEAEDGSCRSIPNPLVTFYPDSVQPNTFLNLPSISSGVLDRIDEVPSRHGEFIHFDGIDDTGTCDQLADVTQELGPPVFGKLPDGSWLQFDPRMLLEENSLVDHLPDGGGLIAALTEDETKCANAPRTFLNEEECALSSLTTTCGSISMPDLKIHLDANNINALQDISGQYIYAIAGLPVNDTLGFELPWVCTPGLLSRWEIVNPEVDSHDCTATPLGLNTSASLIDLLVERGVSDTNIYLREILFPSDGSKVCNDADNGKFLGEEIIIDDKCFRRVHPDHLNVYDFTYWTLEDTHPGNMIAMMHNHSNPIKKWRDEFNQDAILIYPAEVEPDSHHTLAPHPIHRWNTYSRHFAFVGKFGDEVRYVDLPNEIRLDDVAKYFGAATELAGAGIMVCGSPFEVANDPTEGDVFEVTTGRDTPPWSRWRQREHVWAHIGLNAPDQLRQRVSWALAQLFVIAQGAISDQDDNSEMFLTYYDIFSRNAFGNFKTILKEISFSPLMAENLSFLKSKSAAYIWEKDSKITFADENFAREIMQLFTTGMTMLNIDGTPKLDEQGNTALAYTTDEIMSFARVWTGFDYNPSRGNIEFGNRHDPMRIEATWRDKFPKSDMLQGYIGDGYPVCSDLPDKMFLRKGALYRLLGSSSSPELMEDTKLDDPKKFVLDSTSLLKAELCAESGGNCQFANSVTLNSTVGCTGSECKADTLRVVEVGNGIHYEYVRPACVEQVFYANPKKVIYKRRTEDSSCANPLLPYASEACCDQAHGITAQRDPGYLYDHERVTFASAVSRCDLQGKSTCDFNEIEGLVWDAKGYHWTSDSCQIQVKIDYTGQVALVYKPNKAEYLHKHVRGDNRNFFKVYWDGVDYPKNNADVEAGNSCGNNACESLPTGGCLCGTTTTKSRVFGSMPTSAEEVLSKLTVGAFDPEAYDSSTYLPPITENGVTAYLTSASSDYDTDTIFAVVDDIGRPHLFKNTKEYVRIEGATEYGFRNAPSFMSVLNTEADARDAYYETEAALDHYFYHPNTAPFIAHKMIQRFTTSNPKPRYVKVVATAFRTGNYDGIGSGEYGDLKATIAAVLLDREARSINLDADPFKGGLREPLLRVIALMRGMQLELADGEPVTKLFDLVDEIGQAPHSFPTVFSFFLPEYVPPDSRVDKASLVAPEAMIMDMPKVMGLLNGLFSLIKYGLRGCNGGFGSGSSSCTEGSYGKAQGNLAFSAPFDLLSLENQAEKVITDLSTILCSGRLSSGSKELIKSAYISKLNVTAEEDPDSAASALRLAQQLIVTTPEFHTNNIPKMTGEIREKSEPPPSAGTYYKAVVYVLFGGGADSYQMLIPHTCDTGERDLNQQYRDVRDTIAIDRDDLRPLKNVTGQPCEVFGVHPSLSGVQEMFNNDELLFFANTGGLTKETDKENYRTDTLQGLFAHNLMQTAAQRVDPLKAGSNTGVLGRIRDALTKKGRSVGAFSIDGNSISLIGEAGVTSSPMILSRSGVTPFNKNPSSVDMSDAIKSLNSKTEAGSGVFGELYSESLVKSLDQNELLVETLSDKTTSVEFPDSSLGDKLSIVAKMIDTRKVRNSDADVFFLSTGGWDTHSNIISAQMRLFGDVDASFTAFANEMKAQEVWDSVTLIQTSDFARTLTPNGSVPPGSDHAWGGNYIMMGGSVKGGQIVGKYPSDIGEFGPRVLSRGRVIPTTSWDAVFLPIAEWAGVDGEIDIVIPNKNNYPPEHFPGTDNLFHPTPVFAPTASPTSNTAPL